MLSGYPNLQCLNLPNLSALANIALPMMPVEPPPPPPINQIAANFEWDRDLQEWDWSTVSGGLDLEVPPEEFWRKFEELPDLGDNFETLFAEVNGLGNITPSSPVMGDVLRNHDCMWAGVCHSKEHSPKTEEPQQAPISQKLQSPQSKEKKRTVIVQMSRSLLINNRPPKDNKDILRPDTPQSSESEDEPVAATTVSPTEVTGQYRRTQYQCPSPQVTTVQFDHNYGNKKLRTDELGVQTPSDSEEEIEEVEEEEIEEDEDDSEEEEEEEEEEDDDEDEDEEIDVVSLSNTRISPPMRTTVRTIRTPARTLLGQRNAHTLPTNPSKQMQNQIQNEMASAITTSSLISASKAVSRRLNGAIKRKRTATATPARGRRRANAPKRSRFSNGYLIDTEKRSLHNNMERLRRVDLRNAFEDLRQLVPATADSHKAAKVTILKDATHYVRELHLKDRNCSAQLVALRREQDRLRTTLSQLRRIFAYKNSQQIL